eukprot:COSAG02_NODE_1483_length_12385_cov_116.196565_7_plen_200_part_00
MTFFGHVIASLCVNSYVSCSATGFFAAAGAFASTGRTLQYNLPYKCMCEDAEFFARKLYAYGNGMWRCARRDCMNAQVRNFRAKSRAKFRAKSRAKSRAKFRENRTFRTRTLYRPREIRTLWHILRTLWYLAQDTTAPDTLRECLAPTKQIRKSAGRIMSSTNRHHRPPFLHAPVTIYSSGCPWPGYRLPVNESNPACS